MPKKAKMRQMTAVPAAERDQVLYLSRSSPPPSQVPKLIPTLPSILSNSITYIQSLDSEISALTAKIRAMERDRTQLEQNRAEWSEHQSCCQSLLAPIRSLPTELLQLIFENLVPHDFPYFPEYGVPESHRVLAFVSRVSRVSHLWRSVAIACPRLWTTIELHRTTCTWPYLREVVLPRTMQCGLDMTTAWHTDGVGKYPSLQSHHIQRLCVLGPYFEPIMLNAGWPNLVHLALYARTSSFHDMFSIAPKLHTVTLLSGEAISKIFLPWVQIRFLTLQRPGIRDLRHVLPIGSNLESLTVVDYKFNDEYLDSDESKPIFSPMLRTLECQVEPYYNARGHHLPFRLFTMPNLHALQFTSSEAMRCSFPPASDFRTFQGQSQCRIRVLSITNLLFLATELVDFISLIPTLQELTVVLGQIEGDTVTDISFDDEMFLTSLNATQSRPIPILPNLKSLIFEHTVVSDDLLVNAILSRQYPNGGDNLVSCLEFISVVVTAHVFNRAVIDPLVGLRAGGLRLILEDTSSRY